jgi:mono/diheme cytochrome c family protein
MSVYRSRHWASGLALAGMLALPALAADEGKTTGDAAAIYKRQCSSCHGPDGAGKTAMGKVFKLRDLGSAEVQKLSDSEMFNIIANGKGEMPAYAKSLGHDKIHEQVKYMRELAKKK